MSTRKERNVESLSEENVYGKKKSRWRWRWRRKKGILVGCNKKGLSFIPLWHKYNAQQSPVRTHKAEALLLIHRSLIRAILCVGSYYSFIWYRLRTRYLFSLSSIVLLLPLALWRQIMESFVEAFRVWLLATTRRRKKKKRFIGLRITIKKCLLSTSFCLLLMTKGKMKDIFYW